MLKLKKHVIDFLKANVKPEHLHSTIEQIETSQEVKANGYYLICSDHSVYGVWNEFRIKEDDFEQVEELKPYVWYPREMFDGNPKHYWTIERFNSGEISLFSRNYPNNKLADSTTHFMYIAPFEEQDHDAS